MHWSGVELAISQSQVQRPNHYTTKMCHTSSIMRVQIIMSEEVLRQIEIRLTQAVALYEQRLDWLTSDSRRVCGVISENSVCLILDFQSSTDRQFELFIDMVVCLLNEQVSWLSHFNILW